MSLAALGGAAGAVVSLLLAGAAGAPYLTAEAVNWWIVVFAAALLTALVAAPFVIERSLRERRGVDGGLRDERWEAAALAWGGISVAVLLVAVPLGLAESFSGDSLVGTAALLATIEASLVLATLVLWLFSG